MRFQLNEMAEILLFISALAILISMDARSTENQYLWMWSTGFFLASRVMSRRRGVETWQNLITQTIAFGCFTYALTH
jgi:hypothetical protein